MRNIHVFILSIALPTLIIAGALERYSLPQQQSIQTLPQEKAAHPSRISEDIYLKFKHRIAEYSPQQKKELVDYYNYKMGLSVKEKNIDAAAHYHRLIEILNAN